MSVSECYNPVPCTQKEGASTNHIETCVASLWFRTRNGDFVRAGLWGFILGFGGPLAADKGGCVVLTIYVQIAGCFAIAGAGLAALFCCCFAIVAAKGPPSSEGGSPSSVEGSLDP